MAPPAKSANAKAPKKSKAKKLTERSRNGDVMNVAPVAISKTMKGNQGDNLRPTVNIIRREYVGDIVGSTTFVNYQYSCNPGVANLFPWMSQIANAYEEYVVNSMAFCYEPSVGTGDGFGSLILSFDYDALDVAPVDKISALESSDSVRCAPWAPCKLALKSADLKRRCSPANLFVRSGTVSNTDLKTYDLGNLNVTATGNQSSSNTIGELWIEYNITLAVPQRAQGPGMMINAAGVAKATPFTGTQTVTGNSIVATATGAALTFKVGGYYLITHLLLGTGITAITTPSVTSGGSISALTAAYITGTTGAIIVYQVRVLAGSVVTFDDATGNTTVTNTQTAIAPWFTV